MIAPLNLVIAEALLTKETGCAKNCPPWGRDKISCMLERQNTVAVYKWHTNYLMEITCQTLSYQCFKFIMQILYLLS